MLTYEDIRNDPAIRTYIQRADESLGALGYTEHSFAHVSRVAKTASYILETMGYSKRDCELAQIAGYLHDIGNIVNRTDHAQSGAIIAFRLLDHMGMDAAEAATIVTAIGNHDEGTGEPVSELAAALILADKSDVRRSRVRASLRAENYDIHDRVNYAVERSAMEIDPENRTAVLNIVIDTTICPVMEYFEIFLTRMVLCRQAAQFLNLQFELIINDTRLL